MRSLKIEVDGNAYVFKLGSIVYSCWAENIFQAKDMLLEEVDRMVKNEITHKISLVVED